MHAMNINRQVMEFFKLDDFKYQTSLNVNAQLCTMSKNKLKETFQKFGLSLVWDCLDIRTINVENGKENISGFIRYMDAYLIEMSGGKRTELLQLGEKFTGKRPKAFSMRLMRMEIISNVLSSINKKAG